MKDANDVDVKKLREAIASLNGAKLVEKAVVIKGKTTDDMMDELVEAVESLDEDKATKLPEKVILMYNDLISDEASEEVEEEVEEEEVEGKEEVEEVEGKEEVEEVEEIEVEEGAEEVEEVEEEVVEEEEVMEEESEVDEEVEKQKKVEKPKGKKKEKKKTEKEPEKLIKKEEKTTKYTRSDALIASFSKGGNKKELIKQANKLYIKNGGSDNPQVAKALLGYVLPSLLILKVVRVDKEGIYTLVK